MPNKAKEELAAFGVMLTEFWRAHYPIPATDPANALEEFKYRRRDSTLPQPDRWLLATLDPDEVRNGAGQKVWSDPPPKDDAERALLVEMWRSMKRVERNCERCSVAYQESLRFISQVKGWDIEELRRDIDA